MYRHPILMSDYYARELPHAILHQRFHNGATSARLNKVSLTRTTRNE
jgi:hypothetical protein